MDNEQIVEEIEQEEVEQEEIEEQKVIEDVQQEEEQAEDACKECKYTAGSRVCESCVAQSSEVING
jgi:hypothetical protein